jgi:hypothetical protein
MSLADPWWSDQAETAPDRGKFVGELLRLLHRAEQLLVRVSDECIEIALAIPRRHARLVQQPRRQSFTPAVAAVDSPYTLLFYRLPSGIVAQGAGHWRGGDCTSRRRSVQVTPQLAGAFRSAELLLGASFDLPDPFA